MRQLNRELKAFPGVKQKIGVLWETSVRNEGTVCGGTAKRQESKMVIVRWMPEFESTFSGSFRHSYEHRTSSDRLSQRHQGKRAPAKSLIIRKISSLGTCKPSKCISVEPQKLCIIRPL